MRRALELAARGLGDTNPNPAVGCVIVKHGRRVGEGYHRRAGTAHAEAEALAQAGERARGATLYVNLEPCDHQGQTPPCAAALVKAGISRVVASTGDPNPLVAGRGFRRLSRAGIVVTRGILEDEARRLNEGFLGSMRARRPFITLKAALTLDGRIATPRGESKWITSPRQRRLARRLRCLYDGVAVGIGTVVADDPLLLPGRRLRRRFYRVVLDSRLRLPPDSRLVRSARRGPVWVLTRAGADTARRRRLEERGVTVIPVASVRGSRSLSLPRAFALLRRRGLRSVLVEGGSEVLGGCLAVRLVDKLVLFRAPRLLGGRDSRSAFGGPNPRRLASALRLRRAPPSLVDRWCGLLGDPLVEVWYPAV
jgi:diaminohydroxyphosphoribosylaminopyrimidine deaminase / 5-amino-6-(5-phosphoribosylamino)uracil reductase